MAGWKHVNDPYGLEDCGPTPETAAKLRQDPILALYIEGFIQSEHLEAYNQIIRIYSAFQRSFLQKQSLERSGTAGKKDPIDRLTAKEAAIWSKCYRPWAEKCGPVIHVIFDAHDNSVIHNKELFKRILDFYLDIAKNT